jgi:hypothetical protein
MIIKEVLWFVFPFHCTNSTDVDKLLCVVVLCLSIIKYHNIHVNNMCIVFIDRVASRQHLNYTITPCIVANEFCFLYF